MIPGPLVALDMTELRAAREQARLAYQALKRRVEWLTAQLSAAQAELALGRRTAGPGGPEAG
jgi:multidrug resistance efflux pump